MKRYFVCWIAALLLAYPELANAKPNLQLILEGPFVVCESTPKTLTIAIPNLQASHYVPGLVSAFNSRSLGQQGDLTKYQVPPGTDYQMAVWTSVKAGVMALKPDRNNVKPPLAYFYAEKGNCSKLVKESKSISLTVPYPNEVWALNPTDNPIAIEDQKTGAPVGECKSGKCNYATKIVLRYEDVEDLCVTGFSNGVKWCADSAGAVNGEIQVELSADPIVAPDEAKENSNIRNAFLQGSDLSGVPRKIDGDPVVMEAKVQADGAKAGSNKYPPQHRVCQGVPIFLCTAGKACAP